MNVLIIGTVDTRGGAAKVSWKIKQALEKQGHTTSMFVAEKHSDDPSVHVIKRSTWRKYLSIFLASERFLSTDWILKTSEFKDADIIHCHNIHGRFFNLSTLKKMAQKKPVVWTLHDEWAITPHCAYTLEGTKMKNGLYVCPSIHIQPRLLWDNTKKLTATKTKLYKQISLHLVTPSKWLTGRVQQTDLGQQDVQHIPNGIDTAIFTKTDKEEAREKLNLPKDKKIVLFLANAGKANTWKGWKYVEKVIEYYKDDPSVIFLNVGNLTLEENTKQIIYRGHIDSEAELALYYSAADVLLFTSIAENFPLVLLEALSCGLPVVSFDVGGTKEIVTHKQNGFIASYRDTDALIEGTQWILGLSISEHTCMSETSVKKINDEYDTSHMTTSYLHYYLSILEGSNTQQR